MGAPRRWKHDARCVARGAWAIAWLLVLVGCQSESTAPAAGSRDHAAPAVASTESAAPAAPLELRRVRYGRDVRPILSDRCFQCHGMDAAARQAGLRLDQRDSALRDRGGYAAIVPHDADTSEVARRTASTNLDERMPPANANKPPLSPEQIETLRLWIEQGAEYDAHWAFVPPVRLPAPEVGAESWPLNEIDRFVLARLDRENLAPSPDTDRATLLRRVFLDLTGLPPTPEEIDAFLADDSADAYEQWVDRLLGEEPYRTRTAERLTTPWLDAARYGDTSGIHTDNGRQIWHWRDWVIRAWRDNMPYDRFLTEQLAGDLIADATPDQVIASGFNRNHVTTDEGGAIAEEYRVEYAVDRATTTATVFLGLTMGCARCHDHKYDPFTQEDFYSLYAYFNSIDEPGLYSQTQDAERAYEPFIELLDPQREARLAELAAELETAEARLSEPLDRAAERLAEFARAHLDRGGVEWAVATVLDAVSTDPKVTLTPQPDGAIQAEGPLPAQEDYVIRLRTEQLRARLLLLEALATPEAGPGAGRASHGNAVLSGLTVESRPLDSDAEWRPAPLRWAWSDHTQMDGDFEAPNVIDPEDKFGWAADGNAEAGTRLLMLLTEEPFDNGERAELRVTLRFRSPYPQHSLGRVRFRTGRAPDATVARLPVAFGRWVSAGAFEVEDGDAFDVAFGPEEVETIDPHARFLPGDVAWKFDEAYRDGVVVPLPEGRNATYVARRVWSPTARHLGVSLGSDDGFRLFVNGEELAALRVNRGAAPDQDYATLPLRAGLNLLVLKIVNTGGPGGFYFRADPPEETLRSGLLSGLIPLDTLTSDQTRRFALAWRRVDPEYRARESARDDLHRQMEEAREAIPRTMVMRELEEQRPTFVLTRGQYDHPDQRRPAPRRVPAALGHLPEDAPANRLGLAQWLVSQDNPLVARVAVNRFWELTFGAGIVRTSQDFGLQGEWPTHPELLDWLAVDFRESGWDVRRLLRMMVTSRVYRQESRVRPDLLERDPDNRLLARYSRRRLGAEQIRDLALSTSGLLVEKLGGKPVKPYQPAGLWKEVAMPASNTGVFERSEGGDLWRRSVYTLWKRASPPPAMLMFDAPTRESCVIRRPLTNTPLQALALWNDEQFVEASRALAQRTLAEREDDVARLTTLFRRCTGRAPAPAELQRMRGTLEAFRERYESQPQDAQALLAIGAAPAPPEPAPGELAAWTLIANALLSLHETITQH